ncbi:MAG: succinylglutamate desuccinylase/aspartoacylase family protein [Chloroflexota bacterium]
MHFQDLDVSQLPRSSKSITWLAIAPRVDGGTWRLPLLNVTGATSGPVLVVTAAVHGDEYEGVEAIPQVFQQVEPDALRGTLVMLPVCNMPAYEAATRNSPIDGLNLARVFPGGQHGTITQRIAYWITQKLLKPANFFIDLHSGGAVGMIPTLIGYIHDEDELGQLSQAAARAFGVPVLWGHPLPLPPGRTISAATELGVPSLYSEAPGGGYARPDDVACFTQGVINVMRHLEMLDGEPEPRPTTHHLVGDGNLDSVISAPVAGFFRAEVELLDEVDIGQRLGTVRDLFGAVLTEVKSEQAGVVIFLRRLHRVHVGDSLVHVTGKLS